MKIRIFAITWTWIWIFSIDSVLSNHVGGNFKLNSPLQRQILSKSAKPISDEPISGATPVKKMPLYTKFFPIYPRELTKFFGLSSMMFWAIFVFTLARDTKDALIVTSCGAEAIAFLKVYGVIPAATFFMILYTKLASILSPKALFYTTLSPFMIWFPLFSFILYPLRGSIHPLSILLPSGGLSYPINIIRHWSFALYFIMAELWGSAGVPLLFWSFANSIVSFNQSKRFYPLMALIGNFAPIISGLYVTYLSQYLQSFSPLNQDYIFELSLKYSSIVMMTSISMIALLHKRLMSLSMTEKFDPALPNTNSSYVEKASHEEFLPKRQKPRLSIADSFRVLGKDRYLGNIAKMVLSYGLAIEFTEILWKAIVKKAFPTQTEYLSFMTQYSALVGIGSTIMMLIGSNLVSSLGWKVGALSTPVIMGLVALPFYLSLIFSKYIKSPNALLIPVYIGLLQNVLSKASKYALFDPTKEMAYIPLDKEAKVTGKAAIDVLCARLGKSMGAFIQQLLVVFFGSITKATPIISFLFYGVIALWLGAVNTLAPLFQAKNMT